MNNKQLFPILILSVFLTATGAKPVQAPLRIKVVYLEDSRFPTLTQQQLDEAFGYAKLIMQREYDLPELEIVWCGTVPAGDYFNRVLEGKPVTRTRIDPFNPRFPAPGKGFDIFWNFYGLENLKAAVPPPFRETVKDRESFREAVWAAWLERIPRFTGLVLNGKKVFTPETLLWQSYSGWMTLFEHQTDYDLFITNTLIFYDDPDYPYPHTVFYQCKTGGMGEISPGAPFGNGFAAMVSLAGYTGLPGFPGPEVTDGDLPEILGVYLIAHELAHMLLNLPDNYDHGMACLMYSPSAETIDVAEGARAVLEDEKPCPRCRKDVARGKKQLKKRK
jgi:hypothetical protein